MPISFTAYSQPCLSANDFAASSLSKFRADSPTWEYGSPLDVQPIKGFSHLRMPQEKYINRKLLWHIWALLTKSLGKHYWKLTKLIKVVRIIIIRSNRETGTGRVCWCKAIFLLKKSNISFSNYCTWTSRWPFTVCSVNSGGQSISSGKPQLLHCYVF